MNKIILVILLLISSLSFSQTRNYTSQNLLMAPRAMVPDSFFTVPRNSLGFFMTNAGKDSLAGILYNTTANKFAGKFNTGTKYFATEDSVLRRWDSTTVKNYVANTASTPTSLPVSTIYTDGTSLTSFPTGAIIYVTPTSNGTIELSSSAVYPGYANKVAVIINTSNYTYNIHGVAVSSKIVWAMWNSSGAFAGFTTL